ncbi:MAG: glycosyltransferase [Ruminococcaceae bacterium]|nr:glycosyltransferase [Oscillospiraceae bacterium]
MKNANNPLISVVVPVYKVEPYLKKCVESILAQTYSNLEIILVDDGSPDNCGKICDELKQKDPRIFVIHKSNGGLSSARNAGIEIARGEYIGFVDSDDTVEPNMYENLYAAIQHDKTTLAVCAVNYVYEDGKVLTKPGLGENAIFNFPEAMIEMNLHRLFDMATWSKLYHRDLFDSLRFPVGKLSEDYYVMFHILDRAQRISYVDTRCYNYLQRKNSVTRSNKINHDHEYAALEQMEYLEKNYPEMNVVGHVAYASAALTVYDSYLKNKVRCPKEKLDHFKTVVRENQEYIKQADFLPKSKQIQFSLFGLSTVLYNIVFKTYRKIKRI